MIGLIIKFIHFNCIHERRYFVKREICYFVHIGKGACAPTTRNNNSERAKRNTIEMKTMERQC